MKKILALLLAALMLFALAACTKTPAPAAQENTTQPETAAEAPAQPEAAADAPAQPEAPAKYPAEPVKIGFLTFDTTADQFVSIQAYYAYLSQFLNIEMVYSESIASAEQELAFIESCAAAGCKAIIGYYNIAREESVQLTIDKGMYYYGVAEEDSVYETFKSNPMYLGGYYAQNMDYQSGYEVGKGIIDAGCTKLVYASGGRDFGIKMFIDRSAGFYQAVEDAKAAGKNVEVVYDVSGWPNVEGFSSEQAAALDKGPDGIVCSFGVGVWLQPMSNAGSPLKISSIDSLVEPFIGPFQGGMIANLVVEPTHIFGLPLPLIINAVDGNLVRDESGFAPRITVARLNITTGDEYAAYVNLDASGEYVLNGPDVLSVIKGYNAAMTYQSLCDLYVAQGLDQVAARHSAQ